MLSKPRGGLCFQESCKTGTGCLNPCTPSSHTMLAAFPSPAASHVARYKMKSYPMLKWPKRMLPTTQLLRAQTRSSDSKQTLCYLFKALHLRDVCQLVCCISASTYSQKKKLWRIKQRWENEVTLSKCRLINVSYFDNSSFSYLRSISQSGSFPSWHEYWLEWHVRTGKHTQNFMSSCTFRPTKDEINASFLLRRNFLWRLFSCLPKPILYMKNDNL